MRLLTIMVICSTFLFAQQNEITSERKKRRSRLAAQMQNNSVLMIFSPEVKHKNSDIHYEYRTSSNLYYLTGITQPQTILIIEKQPQKVIEHLFIAPKDWYDEMWEGKRLTPQQAQNISGISSVHSHKKFSSFTQTLHATSQLYLEIEDAAWISRKLYDKYNGSAILLKKDTTSCKSLVANLRFLKSKYEIDCLRKAIVITESGLRKAVKMMTPGMYEYQIEAQIEYAYKENNADWGFPSIVAAGENAAILHYTKSQGVLEANDLVLMDVGAAYKYYSADITRTVPASGKFTVRQKQIYELVLQANIDALQAVKLGASLYDIHRRAVKTIKNGLYELGLTTKRDSDQYRIFFMHGTCHWLGLDTHDVAGDIKTISVGSVFTIEPGIYIGPNTITMARMFYGDDFAMKIASKVKEYMNTCVRIEDDIWMSENGPVVLSTGIPKAVTEIEELMAK
ncbi:aminopeptidase P family protein [Candidatus Uabimicrobium amorphum]|uniref:Xaa-Pro aminopeptidase n=1 Tax=Uabimicrobium amorphum TaxID=2596890 RepID=A0A5S9IIY0_UABAM|nr:aminopeptidase P family protein [Candidatus Uabimicrobium amorphum]BBM82693.1 Xaa-Pro aminopeptidase [Candidatus Uabimicrobium amorphum]